MGGDREAGVTKGHEEMFRADSYVHYLDCGNGPMDVYACQDLSNCTILKSIVFCDNYTSNY